MLTIKQRKSFHLHKIKTLALAVKEIRIFCLGNKIINYVYVKVNARFSIDFDY